MEKRYSTKDSYQAAALSILLNEDPELLPARGGRIIFVFSEGKKPYEALARLSAGASVICIEYIEKLRMLREAMYSARDEARAGGK